MTRSFSLPLALLCASSLGFLGSACSGGDDDGDDQVSIDPVIEKFEVDKDLVQAGDTVILSWKVSNANSITINQSGQDPLTTPQVDAQQAFVIQTDTTFEIVATNPQGGMASKSVMVTVDGIRIESFEASATAINRRETVTLTWSIVGEDPTSVIIDDGGTGAPVYEGMDATGSVDVQPDADVTYTLTAQGSTGTKTAMVTIMVTSQRPTIVFFECRPSNTVLIGGNANLAWETTADEVQVLEDGNIVRPWNSAGAQTGGTLQRPISKPSTTFTLQARNTLDPNDVVEETITVMGLETPQFSSFTVTPLAYTQASTVATVTWEVTNTDTLELRVNNRVISGFPTTQLSGTFDVTITGEPVVRLLATNAVSTTEESERILFGYDEPEPNDGIATAIPIAGDRVPVRGTISDPTDVDWYAVMVPQGSLLFARAGIIDMMGVPVCSFDTTLTVYTSTGAQIGFNDNGPAGVAPCAQINPLLDAFAAGMDAGVYYIAVGGSGAMPTGQYSLEVEVLPAPVSLPATATQVGTPSWSVGGYSMWADDMGMGGAAIDAPINQALAPFQEFGGVGNGVPLMVTLPLLPQNVPSYANMLPLFLAVNGLQNRSTFTPAELMDPQGMLMGFTIYPGAGSPTGPSFDFANGPIIPNGLFEIGASIRILQNGTEVVPLVGPLGVPSFSQYAAIGLPPVPNAGDGDSHRHIFGFFSSFVLATPPASFTGSWVFHWELRDTTGAGYDIDMSFTVN